MNQSIGIDSFKLNELTQLLIKIPTKENTHKKTPLIKPQKAKTHTHK